MRIVILGVALLLATPVLAEEVDHAALLERALTGSILPGFAAFETAAEELAEAATARCETGEGDLRPAFAAAYAAWMAVDAYRFGPVEEGGVALSVNFWPDRKNFVGRALRGVGSADPDQRATPGFIADRSAAVQGLPALERLIVAGKPCPLAPLIARHLALSAQETRAHWADPGGWASLMRAAGPKNPVYLTPAETSAELYKALQFGLQTLSDARLGRPLGSFDAPRPKRAEAWRSGLSRANALAQFAALHALYRAAFALLPGGETLDTRWTAARTAMERLPASIPDAVGDLATRLKVEAAKNRIDALRAALGTTLAPRLGIAIGFNSADGD